MEGCTGLLGILLSIGSQIIITIIYSIILFILIIGILREFNKKDFYK